MDKINDAFIFRFAKVAPTIETLRREVELLRRLQPHISLPMPQPAFTKTRGGVLDGPSKSLDRKYFGSTGTPGATRLISIRLETAPAYSISAGLDGR